MSNRAWVTLATNDSYGLGALVLAHSLRRAGSAYPAVVLITPSVTEAMRDRLGAVFAEVVTVDVLDSMDAAHLALLQRPELGITFTKIHCWNLTQYEKCVFLDADTLIIQNCDELFEREELSAAPDVGWPDCFNSGVFVYKPSAETFTSLIQFAQERGSFDGGDQGLLNSYFSDWARGDINKHLPFLYNVTSAAFYSYLPALKHYGQNLKIIHFIGAAKPWLQHFNWETRTADAAEHLRQFLQLWWDIFIAHVHSVLDISMVEIEEAPPEIASQDTFRTEPRLDYGHYEPILDPESEFPWHHPDAQIPDAELNVPEIDMTQFHDPWDIYKGHIPPHTEDSSSHHKESEKAEHHEEMRKYAWDYMAPQHHAPSVTRSDVQSTWQHDHSHQQQEHTHIDYYQTPQHAQHIDHSHHEFKDNLWDYNLQHNYDQSHQSIYQQAPNVQPDFTQPGHNQGDKEKQNYPENFTQSYLQDYSTNSQQNTVSHYNQIQPNNFPYEQINHNYSLHFQKDSEESHFPSHIQYTPQQNIDQVYCVHFDHEKNRESQKYFVEDNEIDIDSKINGHGETDSEIFENITPRHPYDGFYLRHRMTIDSRGRKICTHEIPPTPSPSPSPSPPESPPPIFENEFQTPEEEITSNLPCDIEYQTGVAGNFARIVLGAGSQRDALDDLTRRQGWEAGNIDYMGADAFDNIWAKISQTLSQPRSSPPKEGSPPRSAAPSAPPAAPPAASAAAAGNDPAPAEAAAPVAAPLPTEALAAASVPEPVPEPEPAKPDPVEATDLPTSSVPAEAPIEAKIPELVQPPAPAEPDEIAPVSAEATKVVASAPTEEPKPAAPAEAPVAAEPAAPEIPAPIPSETPEVVEKSEETVPAPATDVTPSKPVVPIPEATPEKATTTTDSPPLANTPSKEEAPIVPSGKSEERRKPAGKLQLHPPAAADPLPTPDSELEDAATLAQSIIASELRTPTVTSPSPPASPPAPPAPPAPLQEKRLSVEEPELATPPAAAVSLSQIGVKPAKGKVTTAAQIESSVSESAAAPPAPAEAPKKKVVKKVLKKDGASSGEAAAPVPPPRKKEKKPKDK